MDAIDRRRSIRRFSDKEIPHEVICRIMESGIKAPSAKNRQPWKFMVIQGQAKEDMLRAFRAGIQREKAGNTMLPDSSRHLGGAEYTVQIMEQAPVVIFVLNPLGKGMYSPLNDEDRFMSSVISSLSARQLRICFWKQRIWESAVCGSATYSLPMRSCAHGWTAGMSWWQPWPLGIRRNRRRHVRAKSWRMW